MFVSVACVEVERASIPFPLAPPSPSTCKNSVAVAIPVITTPEVLAATLFVSPESTKFEESTPDS